MVAPVDPEIPSKGAEGEKTRVKGLTNLTYATIHDAKTSKGIGILVSKDGGYTQIDWSFPETPWKFDPQMEARLSTGDLFRKTAEKIIDNFLSLG
ncbi:hypothetical protein [Lichenifustis flavocetrariae]|uniref:Uncharacterized protein n=1 Tax=Lichenifustis flavocetrariae TaxID=2949735 RepID=A0AA41YZA4_9HYPH|nr:hypothetical protein [Lichenifustis flavocetrariae]MCW6509982.1 hypothetical protein [Lichenifustis flavocetrariae]